MSKATVISDAFGEDADLYEILGVQRDATGAQLRKAYYRKALTCHPDKVEGKEREFQALSVVYEVLKNPESRAEYDEHGELVDEDELNATEFDAWKAYFDNIFGRITTSQIDKFAEKYKCSEEEEQDVLKYYQQFQGDLIKMLESVMLSSERDTQRWVEDFIRPAVKDGRVPDYTTAMERTLKKCLAKIDQPDDEEGEAAAATKDDNDADATESEDSGPKKKNKAIKKKVAPPKAKMTKKQKEAEEAEALFAKIRGKNSLVKRKEGFNNMLSGIASKYGGVEDDPLDDAEFERIQKGLKKRKK
jgi:DnaJ homolog subfamily C member 9